jgi:hypothetical protein
MAAWVAVILFQHRLQAVAENDDALPPPVRFDDVIQESFRGARVCDLNPWPAFAADVWVAEFGHPLVAIGPEYSSESGTVKVGGTSPARNAHIDEMRRRESS